MLDATTELDPRFRMPYEAGALGLSVIVDDYEGAKVMFDKALKQYPNDWEFLYRAAYHYLYDQKDLERAAELLSRAGDAGAPHWVKGLAATLYTTQGQLGLALATLEALKPGIKDPKILQNLDDRIQVLKEQAEIISRSESNKSSETP